MLIKNISIFNAMKRTSSNSYKQLTGNIAEWVTNTDPFDFNKIIEMISLGNDNCPDDEAIKILDNYLDEKEDNSMITAYYEILEAYDKKFGIFKVAGLTINDIKEMTEQKTAKAKEKLMKKIDEDEDNSDVQLDK